MGSNNSLRCVFEVAMGIRGSLCDLLMMKDTQHYFESKVTYAADRLAVDNEICELVS